MPFAVAAPASSAGHTPTVNQPAQLEAGGYNDAAESLTLRTAIAEYAQWSTTPLDYTMNNRYLFDSGNETGDPNFTLAVLQQRAELRSHRPGGQPSPGRPGIYRRQFPLFSARRQARPSIQPSHRRATRRSRPTGWQRIRPPSATRIYRTLCGLAQRDRPRRCVWRRRCRAVGLFRPNQRRQRLPNAVLQPGADSGDTARRRRPADWRRAR